MASVTTPQGAKQSTGQATRLGGYVWWLAASVALVGGYADLWRGGETLAPILLVVGYCVLVPIAILR